MSGENEENYGAAEYNDQFLKRHFFGVIWEAYKGLDESINLFFVNYTKLNRTSTLCGRLWLAVMGVRNLLINSIKQHTIHEEQLVIEYQPTHEKQLSIVRSCRHMVAKAVQFLVIYIRHSEEEWRFLRKGFLNIWSKQLSDLIEKQADNWREFIIETYVTTQEVEDAFNSHLEEQKRLQVSQLEELQKFSNIGKSDDNYIDSLQKMFDDRAKEVILKGDYLLLRQQLNIVEDIADVRKEILPEDLRPTVEGEEEDITEVKDFLKKNVSEEILIDDETVWAHQQGLKDLGPFKLVGFPNPSAFLEVDFELNTFHLKNECTKIDALKTKKRDGIVGKISNVAPLNFSTELAKSFGMPSTVTQYMFMFPTINPATEELDPIAEEWAEKESPLHLLCRFGGFAYLDQQMNLMTVRALALGDDLFFDGPYFLPNASAFNEFENKGIVVQDVTLNPLRDAGARRFCWITPQNRKFLLKSNSDSSRVEGTFGSVNWDFRGCFCYEYDNSDHPDWDGDGIKGSARRNYFQVVTFDELAFKSQKTNNTPPVESFRFLLGKRLAEWDYGRTEQQSPEKVFGEPPKKPVKVCVCQ